MVVDETRVGESDGGVTGPTEDDRFLEARAAALEAAFHSTRDGVVAVSTRGRVLVVNHRFEEIWGLPEGDVKVGIELSEVIGRISAWVDDPTKFEAELLHTHASRPSDPASGRDVFHPTFTLVDGRTITSYTEPALDSSGNHLGRVWFFRDDAELLANQAERADLLDRLQASERAQAFLLHASGALAGTSGYVETVERLGDVAIPILGDIFLIDVLDDRGRPVRVIARHADPTMQPATDRLLFEFAPEADGPEPSVEVMATRRSRWSANMNDATLRATARDQNHFQLLKELDFTSYMCVPLMVDDTVFGAVTLVSAGSGRHFGTDDLALVEALAYPVAQVVTRALQYEQQHGIARVLQTNLLPQSLPEIPGLAISSRYVAGTQGSEVGGDFYDVMRTPSGAVGMMVGDVAGHDPAAAAAMGQVRSSSRALAGQVRTPAELVDVMRASWDLIGVDQMVTVLYGRLDLPTGRLMLASAGHPPPVLVSNGHASVLRLEPAPPFGVPGGPPLPPPGTRPNERSEDSGAVGWEGKLCPGDVLVLYTDGLIERRNRPMQEGLSALTELAASAWNGDPEELCDAIIAGLAGGPDLADDVALLAVSIKP
jgi:PAS domain-containing protein